MGAIKNWSKSFAKKLSAGHDPGFMIIGAQKAGTTTLHHLLDKHPRLSGSFPKEVHYFSKYINYPGRDLHWYRKNFTSLIPRDIYFESTPSYINSIDAPRRIHEHYPDMKLIVLLRDPASRAYSAWNMYYDYLKKGHAETRLAHGSKPGQKNHLYEFFFKDRTSFPSFRETIDAELVSIHNGDPGGPNLLRKGLYYEQLVRYFEYFRREQILILDFNDLVNDPGKLCNHVFRFIGVEEITTKPIARNQRTYYCKINDEELSILHDFYREPDRKLFDLLGIAPLW